MKRHMTAAMLILTFSMAASAVRAADPAAAPVTDTVAYEENGEKLLGYLALPASGEAKLPGVLVVHEWWGLNDYAKRRADQLAQLGYAAFACDMYGGGKVTTDPKEAGALAKALYENPERLRARAAAGLEQLKESPRVDPSRIAVIGYCFGGTVALELAYAGADVRGAVSFHGNPNVPSESEAAQIKASILIAHGDADPLVKDQKLAEVTAALSKANADWLLIRYAHAKHAFTNPGADDYKMPPVAYDEKADRRSWEHMKTFLEEALAAR